jgi:hypothetical protein
MVVRNHINATTCGFFFFEDVRPTFLVVPRVHRAAHFTLTCIAIAAAPGKPPPSACFAAPFNTSPSGFSVRRGSAEPSELTVQK